MSSISQAEAKGKFLKICRDAIREEERVYVRDKTGRKYLTLDPFERYLVGPAVPVSAQMFKDNFSRFSSLVRTGLCFELHLRQSNRTIYARRHSRYRDPLDAILETWRNMVVETALTAREPSDLMRAIENLEHRRFEDREKILETLRTIVQGVARLAIGHRPFEEGRASGSLVIADAA